MSAVTELLHDIGLSGALIAAGFVLFLLAQTNLTPGPLNPGWWLVVAVQLLCTGLLMAAVESRRDGTPR